MTSPMKQQAPLLSVKTNNKIPVLKIKELNENVERFRLYARVCFITPLMKTENDKNTEVIHFRLLDSTGEITATAYSRMATTWIKLLKIDGIYEFQLEQNPTNSYKILRKIDDNLWIHFNFHSVVKPIKNELKGIPQINYTNLKNITNTTPDVGDGFNVLAELTSSLPVCGPNEEYETIQQQFRIADASARDVDITVKGNQLVPRLKPFTNNSDEIFVVQILQARLRATYDDELNIQDKFIAVDQIEADIKILDKNSPLRNNYIANRAPNCSSPNRKRFHKDNNEDDTEKSSQSHTKKTKAVSS